MGVRAYPSPLGIFLVCVIEGMPLAEDIDSGMFPLTVRMASIRPILFSGLFLFCFVILDKQREGDSFF